jgi:hypothetical protein
MSINDVLADIELFKTSIIVLDELVPGGLSIIPVSADATQIARQVWEATQVTVHGDTVRNHWNLRWSGIIRN